jgi:prevent-host-death family protein
MRTVPASELQRKLGEVQDTALKEPVAITRNGRERLVLMSIDEYRRLKRRDRDALWAWELSENDLANLARAEMAVEHAELNAEIDPKS